MSERPAPGRLANAVLLAAAAPAIAVLVLALSAILGGAPADGEQAVFFVVVPALWVGGIGGALWLPTSTRMNIALMIVSAGLTAMAAEVLLGLWIASTTAPAPSTLPDLLSLRGEGVDAFPKIPGSSIVEMSPTFQGDSGNRHPVTPAPGNATVLLCNEDGPLVSYEGDWLGFDNPAEAWEAPVDVALIGDSYTVGVCVQSRDGLGGRLRQRWSTLNLGSSGSGPLLELAILREYVAEVKPSVVVWVYYEGNDMWDLGQEMRREWLVEYLEPGHTQRLAADHERLDAAYRLWVDSLVSASSFVAGGAASPPSWSLANAIRFRSLRTLGRFAVRFPTSESALGPLPTVLERARDDVAAWGGQLYLAYMPAYERYDVLLGEAVVGKRELLSFARSARIPVVDVDEALRSAASDPRQLWASPQGHLNRDGYGVAADAIARALASSLPPSRD